ncbi:Glycosyl hydrolase family protein [Phycisphaerae bacterium RAS1]|nr:Glycosyl hydrolase family protein [Phycisphaerae bacterium RAS1]
MPTNPLDEQALADRHDRREFLKLSALAGLAAATGAGAAGCAALSPRLGAAPEAPLTSKPLERVRVGIVGVGGMGCVHVSNLMNMPNVEVTAVCDIVPGKIEYVQDWLTKAGKPKPAGYSRGPRDFERMCQTEELDIVYNATPWEWHVPVCVAAMKNGKHTAVEVPASYTLDGCWELVETAEKHARHCIMLENCNYDRNELMILNMVRQGVLGEVLHGECGYLHDLRSIKFSKDGEGLWRREHSKRRNGNLYPTHGLGPVAQCMNINRGDRLDYLVSMSSPSRGLQHWQQEQLADDDPRRSERYVLGDVNLTLIRTALEKTLYVVHDTNLPRPYSRILMVQGTRGLAQGWPGPARVHIEGRSPAHQWENLDKYAAEFEHPLWKKKETAEAKAGHGGMDYLESARIVKCLMEGLPMDMDVYDAAMMSAICELTEKSVANRSRPVDVPDFTRGRWKTRSPLGIVDA